MNNDIKKNVIEKEVVERVGLGDCLLDYRTVKHFDSVPSAITMRQIMSGDYKIALAGCQRNFVTDEKTMISHVVSLISLNGLGEIQLNRLADGTLRIMNGQQRIYSVLKFINGDFRIKTKGLPFNKKDARDKHLLEMIDGASYAEFDQKAKNILLDRQIRVELFTGMDERQMAKLYVIENTGVVGLNKMECAKAHATERVWKRIEALEKNESFSNMVLSGNNVRMNKYKSILELLCIQQKSIEKDAFMDDIYEIIDEMNDMDDDGLDIIFNSFMAVKELYDATPLYHLARNNKSWAANSREAYHFFDERCLFYLFREYCLDGKKVKDDIVKIIKDNATALFIEKAKTAEMEEKKNKYNNRTTNGSDKVKGMQAAAALIYNVEEG